MRRTILGLFVQPATEQIETTKRGDTGIDVEEVQETFDGHRIYHGQAGTSTTSSVQAPVIDNDGSISEIERTVQDYKLLEWFAVPNANPGFVAFDTSDNTYARVGLSSLSGGWIQDAKYNLEAVTDHFLDKRNADVWQVVWSDDEEAGTFYPGPNEDGPVKRGLERRKKQIGFRYMPEEGPAIVRGTIAESGYCELYTPDDYGVAEMAEWLRTELLQFSGVENVGSAEDIASGEADFERTCVDCDRPSDDLRLVDDELVCPVCLDKREEEDEENSQTTLDEEGVA